MRGRRTLSFKTLTGAEAKGHQPTEKHPRDITPEPLRAPPPRLCHAADHSSRAFQTPYCSVDRASRVRMKKGYLQGIGVWPVAAA